MSDTEHDVDRVVRDLVKLKELEDILVDAQTMLDETIGPDHDWLRVMPPSLTGEHVVRINGYVSLRKTIELRLRMVRTRANELHKMA